MKIFALLCTFFLASSLISQVEVPLPAPPVPETPNVQPEIFQIPETEATYPGGIKALMEFVNANIKYPQDALANAVQGKVYVSMVVEKDGKLTNVEVIRGVSASLDKEALRVMRSMPNWIPAEQNRKPVRSRVRLPISFTLD